jgi:hypothetical protein
VPSRIMGYVSSQLPPLHMSSAYIDKPCSSSHFHIFELDRFPLSQRRHFTPGHTSLASFEAFQHSLGIDHPGLTHGLSFGLDISSIYEYMRYFEGTGAAFAVIDLDTITDEELKKMHESVS